jgi:rRNA-processing protein FCF1
VIAAMQRLLDMRRIVCELSGPAEEPNVAAAITHAVQRNIQSLGERLTPERFAPLAVWLAQLAISNAREISPIVTAIAARATPPADLASFRAYADMLRPCGPQWALPYPSEFYSPGVLAAVAAWRDGRELRDAFGSNNTFDSIIRDLVDSEDKLRATTGLADLAAVSIGHTPAAAIGRAKSAEVSAVVSAWLNRFQALVEACPSLEALLPNSRLAATHRQMSALTRHLESSDAHVDKRFCHPWGIFVFDTSALIRDPSLTGRLGRDQLVIVTKRVLEELDDLKRDESLRSAVTKASRYLRDHPRDCIRFVDGDPDLLPLDYRSGGTHRVKGDNLILSVAMKYNAYDPILVTNDNNLSLKAHAQNIRALTTTEFHDHAASGWRSRPPEVATSPQIARNPR